MGSAVARTIISVIIAYYGLCTPFPHEKQATKLVSLPLIDRQRSFCFAGSRRRRSRATSLAFASSVMSNGRADLAATMSQNKTNSRGLIKPALGLVRGTLN